MLLTFLKFVLFIIAGLSRTETSEISTTDVSPLRVLTREEPVGKKHPISLPDTEATTLQSKQETDNSSTGKDTGQSRSAKQCPWSSSITSPHSANIPSCVGFATASNKSISISEAALGTAHRLVAVSDGDGTCYHGNTSSSSKSAASDRACCKSSGDIKQKSGSYRRSAAVSSEVTPPGRISLDRAGLKVASVKPTQVADDALKMSYVLKEFDDTISTDTSTRDEFHVTSNKETVSDGTEVTAASDSVCGDNEDIDDMITESRAEKLPIEDISTSDKSLVSSVCESTPTADAKHGAFRADSNQQINISDNSVAVKFMERDSVIGDVKLAQNCENSMTTNVADRDNETKGRDRLRTVSGRSDTSINAVEVEFESEVATTETRKPSEVGLQRVSEKTLDLTEKNIRKSFLPSDVEDKVCKNKSDVALDRTDASTKTGDFAGFRSASGKEILVTEESVKKARDMIDNDELQNPVVRDVGWERSEEKLGNVLKMQGTSDNALGFAGFKSASGKGIRLSEPSIEKARKFMSAIDEESGSRDVDKRIKNCLDDCVDVGGCDAIDVTGCEAGAVEAGGCHKDVISRKMSVSASGKKSLDVGGPTKDYSHLPKGFRPFKAPKSVPKRSSLHQKNTDKPFNAEPMETDAIETPKGTSEEQKGVNGKEISAIKTDASIDESTVTSGVRLSESKETERSFTRESSPGSVHGFDDEEFDDLTYTQISEITELTVACLQHQHEFEDGVFSQAESPCKHGRDRAENTLGVIVEENISGDISCGDGKGGNGNGDVGIKSCDEGAKTYEVVTSEAEHCGFVCDNGSILSEIDPDGIVDITEERESAFMGLSRRRDKSMSGAPPTVRGKKAGVREKVMGRTENLLSDISQLSEWDGDCSFSGSAVDDPLKTCDGPSSASMTVEDVSGLSPKLQSGARNNGRTISGVETHHIPSSVGDGIIATRAANSKDGVSRDTASSICTGFTTARGNKVSVSDKALKELRKIFDDTDNNSISENVKSLESSAKMASTICTGFTTARGNKVSVSDKALNESRKMFDDTDINSMLSENVELSVQSPNKASTICTGFTTARGNKVSVSDKALKESRKIFDDTEINSIMSENAELCVQSPNNASTICTGFTTAKGNKVSVSDKALKESRKIFDDTDNHSMISENVKSLGTICTGFTTAKGNKVSVSDKALKESRKIFDDTDNNSIMSENVELSVRSPKIASTTCTGFTTARGNKVSVSSKALTESRKIFDDTDNNAMLENVKSLESSAKMPSTICTGFTTARGNKVSVSDKALKDSRKIFDDTDDSSIMSENAELCVSKVNKASICTGFTTARGNNVSVSDKSFKESRKIFDDCELNPKDCSEDNSLTPEQTTDNRAEHFTGFLTAGGSKVSVSNKSLKESKKIFEDCETDSKDFEQNDISIPVLPLNTGIEHSTGFSTVGVSDKPLNDSREVFNGNECFVKESTTTTLHEPSTIAPDSCFSGFATARGDKVSVSEKALKESRKVFNDDECFVKDTTNPSLHEPFPSTPSSCFPGFATARGDKVSVSEKALKESRKVFNGNECFVKDSTTTTLHEPSTIAPDSCFSGFATARGDKVSVSEKALKESRKVFNDDECFVKDPTNPSLHEPFPSTPSSCFPGFATARGDKVSVSEKALKESRKVFNGNECLVKYSMNTTLHEPSIDAANTCFSGFATARGDKVSVSDKALKESRKVFNDDECFIKDSTNTSMHEPSPVAPGTGFMGFATARGDKVSVSEKALKESRKVFNDDEWFVIDRTNTTLHEPSPNAPGSCFTGFATARGDKVSVSEKAVKESRNVFNDDECFIKDSTNTTLHEPSQSEPGSCFSGFATARGNTVSVSEKALKESRKMFVESKASVAEDLALRDCEILELAGNEWTSDTKTEPNPGDLHPDVGYIVTDTIKTCRDKEILKDRAQGTSFPTANGGEALTSNDVSIAVQCQLEDSNDCGIVRKNSEFQKNIVDIPIVVSPKDVGATLEGVTEEGGNESRARRWSHCTSTPAVTDRSWKTAARGKIVNLRISFEL